MFELLFVLTIIMVCAVHTLVKNKLQLMFA